MKNHIFPFLIIVLFLVSCNSETSNTEQSDTQLPEVATKQSQPILKTYGIDTENYRVVKDIVKRNQTIGDIFGAQHISYPIILKASEQTQIFDIRKIRTGQTIAYFYPKNDSILKPDYIVYEKSLKSFVVFDLRDSVRIYLEDKICDIKHRKISGQINSSLWNAMVDIDVPPMLSVELSEVYAWSIDFFGLQKGDRFSVIYEESYIDSSFYEITKIDAICFEHANRNYYAFRFKQDSVWSFFDEQAKSLRKAFLKAPLRFSRISSRFTNSRFHPVLKIRRPHHGVDYAAPRGTPVHSVGDGKVIAKGYQKRGGGRYLKIKHNSVYTTGYMHFSRFAKNIKVGDFVQQGQLIGYVGSSGLATGPHLDFRFYKNGTAIDPLKVKSPPVEPVKESHLTEYKLLVKSYKNVLDSLINIVHMPNDSIQ